MELRARVTFQKFLRISRALSLSSRRCLPSLVFPSDSFPRSGWGGSRETLAPCRNYRLAGINSRAYIEWRKTRREGSEGAQEGQERERKWVVVQSWIWRLNPPFLLLDVSFSLPLFLALSPSLFFIRQLSILLQSDARGVSLSFRLWHHQHRREMAAVRSRPQERQLGAARGRQERNARHGNVMWTEMDTPGERDRGEERDR